MRLSARIALLTYTLALLAALVCWHRDAPAAARRSVLLFESRGTGIPLVVAPGSTAELAAAQLVRDTLARSAGLATGFFAIVARPAGPQRPAIRFEVRPRSTDPLQRPVGFTVAETGVTLWATHAEDLPIAASVFLERTVAARWFTPGDLGTEVRRLERLSVMPGAHEFAPTFVSRALGLRGRKDERAWGLRSRLRTTLKDGHTADEIVRADDLERDPRLRPEFNGRPFLQRHEPGRAWQPALASPATIEHVGRALAAKFRTGALAATFGQNDTWRWDQSDATLAAVAPHRWFRHFPDYANTLFGFLNQVATQLEPEFPNRLIVTYAYQWTENVPRFAVHPNVVPFLTADRSQWFDPAWRAEDQELIRRWTQAGPRVVGTYDYYYGAPFLVPRPTLWAVAESIPFLHENGVRAFTAEMNPNWGLDGPKAWLAAQLLWDARQNPAALLDEYYARYWRESAAAMRRFFEICEEQYRHQPRPAYWLKYYQDDHQRLLFPPQVRARLWRTIADAETLARSPEVRARVAQTRAAFHVTELFCRHDERRDELARLLHAPQVAPSAVARAVAKMTEARAALRSEHRRVRQMWPPALSADLIDAYLRNDPRPRALAWLARHGVDVAADREFVRSVFGDNAPAQVQLRSEGREQLADPEWLTLKKRDLHPFTALDWNAPRSRWVGRGEPYETRSIALTTLESGHRAVRFAGVRQESLLHAVLKAKPGEFYRAQVRVRGRVSPGNATFLLVNFSDDAGQQPHAGHTDRLPLGDWPDWTTLETIVRVPEGVTEIGFALRVLYQVNDDFAEFAEPSLQRLDTVP